VQSSKAEFDRRAVQIAVVSFAEPAKLAYYQEHHQWPFVMLADPERVAYRRFGLKRLSFLRAFSPPTLKLYWQLMRRGHRREDYGKEDIYQGGGDFILDRAGNILYVHRSEDPADRPSPAKLLDAIDRVKNEPSGHTAV
jgi:peroxiredoxin